MNKHPFIALVILLIVTSIGFTYILEPYDLPQWAETTFFFGVGVAITLLVYFTSRK